MARGTPIHPEREINKKEFVNVTYNRGGAKPRTRTQRNRPAQQKQKQKQKQKEKKNDVRKNNAE